MSIAPKDFARVPMTLSLMKRIPPHACFEKSREICQNWSKMSCANNIQYCKWEHETICGQICMFIFVKVLSERRFYSIFPYFTTEQQDFIASHIPMLAFYQHC